MGAVPPAAAIRILVVEAHRLFAEALRAKLASDSRLDVVGVAHDGRLGDPTEDRDVRAVEVDGRKVMGPAVAFSPDGKTVAFDRSSG